MCFKLNNRVNGTENLFQLEVALVLSRRQYLPIPHIKNNITQIVWFLGGDASASYCSDVEWDSKLGQRTDISILLRWALLFLENLVSRNNLLTPVYSLCRYPINTSYVTFRYTCPMVFLLDVAYHRYKPRTFRLQTTLRGPLFTCCVQFCNGKREWSCQSNIFCGFPYPDSPFVKLDTRHINKGHPKNVCEADISIGPPYS